MFLILMGTMVGGFYLLLRRQDAAEARLRAELDRRFAELDRRFAEIDRRLAEIDRRLGAVDRRVDETNGKLRDVTVRLGSLETLVQEIGKNVALLMGSVLHRGRRWEEPAEDDGEDARRGGRASRSSVPPS